MAHFLGRVVDGDASLESSGFHFDNFIVQSMVTYNSTATFKGGGMSYYSVNLENGKLNITGNNTIGTYTAVSGTQTLLNGNNTINQFVANPSTSFVLQAGFTQTLTLSSTMNGIPGLQANISFSGASKIVAWWSLKDIKISSGNLIVYRGTDLGDNTNVAFMTGFLKYYTYDVYGYLGDYRGQYNDVVTDPQWSQEINNPGGQIDIRRGVDPTNYGEGTLVDYNNKIVIKAFTEDNINGVVIFQGFTADYTPNIQPSSQYVDIIALSYGAELSQYPLITDPQIDVNIPFNYDPGTINNFTSNKLAIAFTTGSGVTNISSFNTYSMLYRNTKTVTLSLYKDDGSSTPDNTVPIWQETFTYPFGNTSYFTSAYGDFVPAIPSITVLANTKYWLVLDTGISGQADFNNVRTVNPYGNAYAAYWNGSAWVQNSSWGLVFFATYTSSGNTTVTYTGTNIKTALTDILNNYNLQGGHVLWDNTTIDDPGTTFTNTFNSNTVLDGVQKILAQAPAGWYWYVDQATNMLHFHNTANEPKHYFTIGRDLTSVQLQKTMETVVNNVIVSGGPDGSGYNLFREYVNVASQQRYGKRVQFYNDNQITTTAAADAVGTKIITQFKNPTYRAPITVLSYPDKGYNLESIKPGDVFFIMGLSGAVNLQASRVDYKAVTVALDSSTIPPQINNQVADTQNAVQQQQTANNPSFPTIVPII